MPRVGHGRNIAAARPTESICTRNNACYAVFRRDLRAHWRSRVADRIQLSGRPSPEPERSRAPPWRRAPRGVRATVNVPFRRRGGRLREARLGKQGENPYRRLWRPGGRSARKALTKTRSREWKRGSWLTVLHKRRVKPHHFAPAKTIFWARLSLKIHWRPQEMALNSFLSIRRRGPPPGRLLWRRGGAREVLGDGRGGVGCCRGRGERASGRSALLGPVRA